MPTTSPTSWNWHWQHQAATRTNVRHKPRLQSDNGPSYIAGELAEWIGAQGMSHARGAPFHPQTQGKIERWQQTLKNRVLLENYFLPGDLERQIEAFIVHYNPRRTLHSPGHGTAHVENRFQCNECRPTAVQYRAPRGLKRD